MHIHTHLTVMSKQIDPFSIQCISYARMCKNMCQTTQMVIPKHRNVYKMVFWIIINTHYVCTAQRAAHMLSSDLEVK